MIEAVTHGREGTAMQSFAETISASDIEAVVDFVRKEFMQEKAANTRYHTVENGWPNHERYKAAFPFALGEIAVDAVDESLTPEQRRGKQLFMSSCITCHDRARVNEEGVIWDTRAVSYPRNQVTPERLARQLAKQATGQSMSTGDVDSTSGATPYAVHDLAPKLEGLTEIEREGEALFQENCAFCHAADGTGKNWIGTFLEPHPRNLTDPAFMSTTSRASLKQSIMEGLPGTPMSAWKHVLTEAQVESVIAYINRAFHPIGQKSSQ